MFMHYATMNFEYSANLLEHEQLLQHFPVFVHMTSMLLSSERPGDRLHLSSLPSPHKAVLVIDENTLPTATDNLDSYLFLTASSGWEHFWRRPTQNTS